MIRSLKQGSSIKWAAARDWWWNTLVIFMGVATLLVRLLTQLIRHGRPVSNPVAVIRWGTYADQKTWITTLEEVADMVTIERGIQSRRIIVVGEVVPD
jgi:uroporphyrinogen III methyltransferase/synthase